MGHGQPPRLWQPESGSESGVCARPRAAGGEGSAHLAHRGAQAPSDLHVVVVHQKGRDVLPVVALRHPDSGDGGKSGLLRKRGTGFSPTAPGDPSTLPGESITEGGDFSLASKSARAPLQPHRAVSSRCPYSLWWRWWPCPAPTSSSTKSSSPMSSSPWHSWVQLARCRSHELSRPCGQRAERRSLLLTGISWHPRSLQAPRALLVLPCLSGAAHQFRQHGQAFPQAEEAVDGRRVVVPAKLKGQPQGFSSAAAQQPLARGRGD